MPRVRSFAWTLHSSVAWGLQTPKQQARRRKGEGRGEGGTHALLGMLLAL